MRRLKNTLLVIFIIAAVIGGFVFSKINGMEQIEDINGPDDYSLAVITNEEIAADGRKACVGGPNTSRNKTTFLGITSTSGTTYFSKQFKKHFNILPSRYRKECSEGKRAPDLGKS